MLEAETLYRNFYECSECGTKWTDEWTACATIVVRSAAAKSNRMTRLR